MWGVGVGLLLVVPSFAGWPVISLTEIPMRALTFCIVILCLVRRIWWSMASGVYSLLESGTMCMHDHEMLYVNISS